MKENEKTLYQHLEFIYGQRTADKYFKNIIDRLDQFRNANPDLAASLPNNRICENDIILITYGDMVHSKDKNPLKTLHNFLKKHVKDLINTIHILPFFPFSSDDGFSIINYFEVNPEIGKWEDIRIFRNHWRLMFDAVINHVSSKSLWFKGFIKGDNKFKEYFTVVPPGTDLSKVFRPRATPVVTPFLTSEGEKLVWTTFSDDQIDLNFSNPDVLVEVIGILLFFASKGAEFIRLDAVTFVWKEIGTSCVNSPHTHRIVQLFRTIFDIACPKITIITETNVPHNENIAYFGNGKNEAQMIYNFALPALTLSAFHNGDIGTLIDWISTLKLPSSETTFFNFLAGHDGIGLLPIKDILSNDDIQHLINITTKMGGNVSYKRNEDGSVSPYELNINYLDALNDPDNQLDSDEIISKRFLAAQSIMLALKGVPGIYFHSLFGSHNWTEGVKITGRNRTINRERLDASDLTEELNDTDSLRYAIFSGYRKMLTIRKSDPAFNPFGNQAIVDAGKSVFALLRSSLDKNSHTLCLANITEIDVEVTIDLSQTLVESISLLSDPISNNKFPIHNSTLVTRLSPFQVCWLQTDGIL